MYYIYIWREFFFFFTGQYGIGRPFYFPFLPCYWLNSVAPASGKLITNHFPHSLTVHNKKLLGLCSNVRLSLLSIVVIYQCLFFFNNQNWIKKALTTWQTKSRGRNKRMKTKTKGKTRRNPRPWRRWPRVNTRMNVRGWRRRTRLRRRRTRRKMV